MKRSIVGLTVLAGSVVLVCCVIVGLHRYAISVKIKELHSEGWCKAEVAAEWLGRKGVVEAIPELKRAYKTIYQSLRRAILGALIRLGPEGRVTAEQLLVNDLNAKDSSTRAFTVEELVRIGESVKIPATDLYKMLESDREYEVKAAEEAIVTRGDELLSDLLIRCSSTKREKRDVYIDVLKRFKSRAIAEIELQAKEADGGVRDELLDLKAVLLGR